MPLPKFDFYFKCLLFPFTEIIFSTYITQSYQGDILQILKKEESNSHVQQSKRCIDGKS